VIVVLICRVGMRAKLIEVEEWGVEEWGDWKSEKVEESVTDEMIEPYYPKRHSVELTGRPEGSLDVAGVEWSGGEAQ